MASSSSKNDFSSFFTYVDHLKSTSNLKSNPLHSQEPAALVVQSQPLSTAFAKSVNPRIDNVYPQGPANTRFQDWLSPFACRRLSTLHKMVSQDKASLFFKVMITSLDPGTRDSYAGGLKRFIKWCNNKGIPDKLGMPASADTLALFLALEGRGLSNSTHNNWLAGICFWHTIHGADWHGNGHIVTQLCKGLKKVAVPPKRAKRPPITLEHMESLHANLDLSSPKDAAVWAVASIAFWSVCWLGKLVYPDKAPFTKEKYVRRLATILFLRTGPTSVDPSGTEYATLHIPWSKMSKFEGAHISITAQPNSLLCPLAALRNHLKVNEDIPSKATFFSFIDSQSLDGFLRLTPTDLMSRANAIWVGQDFPSMEGHGFRIGRATHLLLMGTPPQVVKAQGHWTSCAFMEYWQEVQVVIPGFILQHNTSDTFVRLLSLVDSYLSTRSCLSTSNCS